MIDEAIGPALEGTGIEPARRPGLVRRAAAGAWHVPAGLAFLLSHTRLWPAALVTAILAAALLLGGLFLGFFALGSMERLFAPAPGRLPNELALALRIGIWASTIALGLLGGLALTLLVSAPLLDRLSRRTQILLAGPEAERPRPSWDLSECFRGPLWFAAALPLLFALGLVPFVGPLLVLALGGWVLGRAALAGALGRRGLDTEARKGWFREWRWESVGFGLAGLLFVPVANALLAPGLAVGSERLLLEIEETASE